MEIYEIEFTERLEHLPNIRLSQIEVKGANVKSVKVGYSKGSFKKTEDILHGSI